MSRFLSLERRKIIFKAIIESQFKCSSLIWMFHSRYTNSKINRLLERASRIVGNDYKLFCQELLDQNKSFCIHYQHIHGLLIEIHTALSNTSENIFSQVFARRNNNIGLHSKSELVVPHIDTVIKGHNSLVYLESVLWNNQK